LGNLNQTGQYGFGYFDILGPNIVSVVQLPLAPGFKETVDITCHIIDSTQIQAVEIESNQTSVLTRYSMTQISGNSRDGVWKFTFSSYPINKPIIYRIITKDILGNLNNTNQFSFGTFDTLKPIITNVIQTPSALKYTLEFVNVKAGVVENFEIATVKIENNATGAWINRTMFLVSGSYQDGIWDFSFSSYPINKSIQYRIFATDISGKTAVTAFYSFGLFPIAKWNAPHFMKKSMKIDQTKDCLITFTFENTGSATLLNLNFTIIKLPPGWIAKVKSQIFSNLGDGDSLEITLLVAASSETGIFHKNLTIRFETTILLTGEKCNDTIIVQIDGGKSNRITIILIIVGSIAAVVSTALIVYRTRRSSATQFRKAKPQVLAAMKTLISKDFPATYTIMSPMIIERINNMKDLTFNERDLLIEYINQLDEEEALAYLNSLEKISTD
jgi:hypothetical protein